MTPATTKKNNSFPAFFDNFFNDRFLDTSPFLAFADQKETFLPRVNVIENNDNFQIELAAPGLKSEDFKVEVKNGILNISSEKEEETAEDGKNFRKREFSFTSFSRSFSLPENVVSDKIDANYTSGVLKLTLPKNKISPELPVKKIKVK
jgi:HSP20 family protein